MAVNRAPRRLGLFGGAFDPPHLAHRAIAAAAVQQLGLERLHIMPTGQPVHRRAAVTEAQHRLVMARLAFAGLARCTVDDSEILRSGPSFTVDTLTELHARHPDAHWTLVLGGDQARGFFEWHRWRDIARMATLALALRPDQGCDQDAAQALRAEGLRLVALRMAPMALSATAIREAVAAGVDVAPMVGPDVARYIDQNQLYRTT